MRWIIRARERIDATRWCPNFVSVSCLYCKHRLRADRRQCRRVQGRRQSGHAFYSDLTSTSANGKGFGRGQNSATNPQRRRSSVGRRFQRTSASAASSVRECATICFRMHRMHRNHELHAHIFVPDGCWTGMALSRGQAHPDDAGGQSRDSRGSASDGGNFFLHDADSIGRVLLSLEMWLPMGRRRLLF
jgi:hypothetical protein